MSPPLNQDYIGPSDLKLKDTELRLGLPGSEEPLGLTLSVGPVSGAKRGFADVAADVSGKPVGGGSVQETAGSGGDKKPAPKAQVVGWPPIRNFRKNTMATNPPKNKEEGEEKEGLGFLYVKVSMDGAPYLRKVNLKTYGNYKELSSTLENMFSCFTIEYVITYEDKDGDWMLVGDVPWGMFTDSCKRMRIMKSSDAIGLAPKAIEKIKSED